MRHHHRCDVLLCLPTPRKPPELWGVHHRSRIGGPWPVEPGAPTTSPRASLQRFGSVWVGCLPGCLGLVLLILMFGSAKDVSSLRVNKKRKPSIQNARKDVLKKKKKKVPERHVENWNPFRVHADFGVVTRLPVLSPALWQSSFDHTSLIPVVVLCVCLLFLRRGHHQTTHCHWPCLPP